MEDGLKNFRCESSN